MQASAQPAGLTPHPYSIDHDGSLDFYRLLFDFIKLSYRKTSRLMPTLKCFPFGVFLFRQLKIQVEEKNVF